jgi:hexokinase
MREVRDKVRQFLKDNGALYEDIDMERFCDVFRAEMQAGLAGSDSSLAMIPTYIEVGKEIPRDRRVIVLDAGGTNFRVAAVHFSQSGEPVIENFVQKPMPGLDKEVGKEEFFATVVEYMAGVVDASESIGFCFSYPTEILPNKDGRLIRFCKEVKAKEVEGELIGQNLLAAIEAAGRKGGKRVAILNDTVATLLAGMSASGQRAFDSYIGFILGTGSNCCYIESNKNVKKTPDLDPAGEQIVNVESGSFGKARRGAIDSLLDESTLDPGKYTFEKMFSGGYFGPLCLKALQHASKQGLVSGTSAHQLMAAKDLETKEVNSFLIYPQGDNPLAVICANATNHDRATVWYLLDGLVERAARVVAAMLSSVVLETDKGHDPCEPVCITAEGTTFYELKSLSERIESYIRCFLQGRHDRFVEFVHVEDATLIGAAIAGLTN